MNGNYKSSAQLKELARRQLEGKFGAAIAMLVLVRLISAAVNALLSALIPAYTVQTLVLQLIAAFITSVIFGVFQVGISLFYLKIACRQDCGIPDLLFGYQQHFEKSLLVSLVVTGVTFVYQVLINLPLWAARLTGDFGLLILELPLAAGGIAVYAFVSLMFSQSYFLLLDFPSYSAGDILKLSVKIMRGHKKRLFYIELSFLPLILLSLLTCGLGLLWVMPYHNMVMADFYLNLMNPEKTA